MTVFYIDFCDRYWNQNAACWIPESYVAIVTHEGTRRDVIHVSGDTEEACRQIVLSEWPSAVEEDEPTPEMNVFIMRRLGVI